MNDRVQYLGAVVILAALAVLVLEFGSNKSSPASDTTTIPPNTADQRQQAEPLPMVNSVTQSRLVNLRFQVPTGSQYVESEFSPTPGAVPVRGKQVYFEDQNQHSPSFSAETLDFNSQDYIIGTLQGSFDKPSSLMMPFDEARFSEIKEVGPGIYKYTGFSNYECGPSAQSHLLVRPPSGSGLKYISFYLGAGDTTKLKTETSDPCLATDASIRAVVNELADGKVAEVETNLQKAIAIAKTFRTKNTP